MPEEMTTAEHGKAAADALAMLTAYREVYPPSQYDCGYAAGYEQAQKDIRAALGCRE
jgi:hypothetical protein